MSNIPDVNVTTEENLNLDPSFDQANIDAQKAAAEQAEKDAQAKKDLEDAEALQRDQKSAAEKAEKDAKKAAEKAAKAVKKEVSNEDVSEQKTRVKMKIDLAFGSKKYKEGDEDEFTKAELDCLLENWYEVL